MPDYWRQTPPPHSLDSDPSTVPNNTCNGICSGCGECCLRMTLRLTKNDIKRIRNYIKTNNIQPCNHAPVTVPWANLEEHPGESLYVDTICPFFDMHAPDGHKCIIYPVRPTICRTYKCDMYSDTTAAKQVFDDTVAACHGEYAAYQLLNSPELNLQQLFFADYYTPKPYDVVVMNEVYHDGYVKYIGIPFMMTDMTRVINKKKECYLIPHNDPDNPIWYPIDGLTVVKPV